MSCVGAERNTFARVAPRFDRVRRDSVGSWRRLGGKTLLGAAHLLVQKRLEPLLDTLALVTYQSGLNGMTTPAIVLIAEKWIPSQ